MSNDSNIIDFEKARAARLLQSFMAESRKRGPQTRI